MNLTLKTTCKSSTYDWEYRESTREQLRTMEQSLKTIQKSHNLAVKNVR